MLTVLRGIPATLPVSIEGEDGPLTLASPPTVTVKDADGLSVATGTATGSAGAYTFAMAAQSRLGPYTATFAGTFAGNAVSLTVPLQVIGGFLFSIPELRTFDAALDSVKYPDAVVKRTRAYVFDEFYNITGRAFTQRGAVETVPLLNGGFLLEHMDPKRVVSAQVDGVSVADVSTFTLYQWGEGQYAGTGSTLSVEYEYGFTAVPEDVKRAALLRARTVLHDNNSGIPDRAMSFNLDGTQYSLATAGRSGFETGVPEVDAVLSRYGIKPPGVA